MYLAFLIICSLAPGYMGDGDTGPTCIRIRDDVETHYRSLSDCESRTREMFVQISADPQWLSNKIPGPYHYRGQCVVPVLDEKLA
jgi:hypothetical protein